ncbi:ribonuclease D [Roseibium limicola]|uniref:Ribonuclease D n=1 Tax=Roseibium limicola TaxID=2816037 RepID=A0A939ER65_9HYPH|nr:ribonuclease D [Roseibium limicola]MBO0345574.1 ribonuclease D [Roseibium limicola]
MTIRCHKNDLPDLSNYQSVDAIAVDTETLGLNPHRDRLCVVQISPGDGTADVVQIERGQEVAPNLQALFSDPDITKIFHFARFDVAVLFQYLDIDVNPIWCTKIASKLARTYTDRHGLKDNLRELVSVEVSKHQQSSDWAAEQLSDAQIAYAASDVLHLHALKARLEAMLEREDRLELAENCFNFLPTRAALDLIGWEETDIFAHS